MQEAQPDGSIAISTSISASCDGSSLGSAKALELRFDIIDLFDRVYEVRNAPGLVLAPGNFGPRRTLLPEITRRFLRVQSSTFS
jgi:hypothetical protein